MKQRFPLCFPDQGAGCPRWGDSTVLDTQFDHYYFKNCVHEWLYLQYYTPYNGMEWQLIEMKCWVFETLLYKSIFIYRVSIVLFYPRDNVVLNLPFWPLFYKHFEVYATWLVDCHLTFWTVRTHKFMFKPALSSVLIYVISALVETWQMQEFFSTLPSDHRTCIRANVELTCSWQFYLAFRRKQRKRDTWRFDDGRRGTTVISDKRQ